MVSDMYRRDGTPYPDGKDGLFEWTRDCQNYEYRRVALDKLPNGVEISTVWLGIDHNYGQNSRPLIFETMLFVPQKSEYKDPFSGRIWKHDRESIGEQWRYSTEEEALRGHKMLVKKWSKFKTADQVLGKTESNNG